MKKLLLLVSVLACGMTSVMAQTGDDTVTIIGSRGNEMVVIEPDQQGDVVIKIGGYAISFKDNEVRHHADRKHHRRSQFGYEVDGKMGLIELGASMLTSPDYSAYTKEQNGFMNLDASKSVRFALNTLTTSVSLSPRGHLRFSSALALIWDNYVISNTKTLKINNNLVVPETIEGKKKSKLTTFSLRLPLYLELDLWRDAFLSAGVYGEWTSAWTKYKSPNTKSKEINNYVNPLRWGFAAKIGLTDGLYLVGDYTMTSLFKTDRGPITNPVSIGIGMLF